MPVADLRSEFDRQLATLLDAGHAEFGGLSPEDFAAEREPLRRKAAEPAGPDGSRIPFVLVVNGVPPQHAIGQVELRGRAGFTTMEADDLKRFTPIPAVQLPHGSAYLITDVDTGRATLDMTPEDGLEMIVREGRSPLTLDEGLSLVTQLPDVLTSMNCFEMVGSRCGDRRVTGLWVSKDGRPRLGWCWAGNPHTWLGMASCGGRAGVELAAGVSGREPAVE